MQKIPVRHISTSNKEHHHAGRFSIRDLQKVLNGNDLSHDMHRHDFFFILSVSKGSGTHEIDFKHYDISDNSIFIVRPGQVHKLELNATSTGFIIEFDQTFYHPKNNTTIERWKKASAKNYCKSQKTEFDKLNLPLTNIFNEFSFKNQYYTDAIISNLDLFFIEYVRQSRNPKNILGSNDSYTQERFEELVHLLEINITSLKNVSGYAKLLHLSNFQLNTITKTSVGKTVSDLINEQIILEAKRYLLATAYQVKDVADHLGYEDVSYFIRFFKKHTGYAPESFRKKFK